MTRGHHEAGIPATERAVVGLCHELNGQLAGVSAYAYLLKKRGALGDMEGPLQEHLDRLAHSVRLVRSLCRNLQPSPEPVAISLLAESLTDTMRAHPDGPIRFVLEAETQERAPVVRCDWAHATRALVEAASWARRGMDPAYTTTVTLSRGAEDNSVRVVLLDDAPEPPGGGGPHGAGDHVRISVAGPREAIVHLPLPEEPTPG